MMESVRDFVGRWWNVILLVIWAVLCLFAFGCCIYVAIRHPFPGLLGCVGSGFTAAGMMYAVVLEVKCSRR